MYVILKVNFWGNKKLSIVKSKETKQNYPVTRPVSPLATSLKSSLTWKTFRKTQAMKRNPELRAQMTTRTRTKCLTNMEEKCQNEIPVIENRNYILCEHFNCLPALPPAILLSPTVYLVQSPKTSVQKLQVVR